MSTAVIILIIAVIAVLGFLAYKSGIFTPVQNTAFTTNGETAPSSQLEGVKCAAAPAVSYLTQDKFGTTTIGGDTTFYKVNTNAATTVAYTPASLGDNIIYWVQNSSTYVTPTQILVDSCNNPVVAKTGVRNGSATLTAYDNVQSATILQGVTNASLVANGQANILFKYQPTAKQGFMPFGGVLVLEQNSTITSVSCNAPFLQEGAGDFHITYIPTSSATHTYKVYKVLPSIDDGSGNLQTFTCQYTNGASSPGNGAFRATLIPANYYYTNAGNIVLDVEQNANSLTTRTGFGLLTRTGTWNN